MQELNTFLAQHADQSWVSLATQKAAVEKFAMRYVEVEAAILELGLKPLRYRRNGNTISPQQQLRLLRSHVAVIGCGGLGGHVVDELARLGVGAITAIDPDRFEEHNLNRQLLATVADLGQAKAEAARLHVAAINPAVDCRAVVEAFTDANGDKLLQGVGLALDALDSIPTRLALAGVCKRLRIPFVHASIAGWYGQLTSQFPGDDSVEKIYAGCEQQRGIESELGNPAFTPAAVASMQVAEACKILIGERPALRRKFLSINLLDMHFEIIEM